MRKTGLAATIFSLLQEKHLLSAKAIAELVNHRGHRYNKTSVYRALDRLLEEGVVCRHYFANDEAGYELREHHHAHLVCTRCGMVTTSRCAYAHPTKIGTFTVNHHHLTLFGVCQTCATGANQRTVDRVKVQ